MGVRISETKRFTATGESDLFSVPGNYVAYLRRLEITNEATALATCKLIYYNGTAKKTVLTKKVAVNETLALAENEVPTEGCPTKLAIDIDQQPVSFDYTLELE